MKARTVIIIFSVLAAAVIIFLIRRRKANAAASPGQITAHQTRPGATSFLTNRIPAPYKKGDRGLEVLFIQAWLNMFKGEDLKLDGIFGPKTLEAVKRHFNTDQVCSTCYDMAIRPQEAILKQYLAQNGIMI